MSEDDSQPWQDRLSVFCVLLTAAIFSSEAIEGFYCDVFNDMGTGLGGQYAVPAVQFLDLSEEGLKTSSNKTLQNSIMVENDDDDNGVLLQQGGFPTTPGSLRCRACIWFDSIRGIQHSRGKLRISGNKRDYFTAENLSAGIRV